MQGTGGDPALNALRNRAEAPHNPEPLTINEIAALPSPGVLTGLERARWTPEELRLAAAQESRTVQLDGYLVYEQQVAREPWNCNQPYAPVWADIRLWIGAAPATTGPARPGLDVANAKRLGALRAAAAGIEAVVSPRWRAANPAWNDANLKTLADANARIRVTGQLLYAEDLAPELVNYPFRLTLWTIDPVSNLEVMRAGAWQELGDTATGQ